MENVASRFGQRLAHTEKKYRDQALKKLSVYLSKRSQWSDLEWDKLWKALFYCMWMSDKRPIQDELSSNLAALVHRIPSVDDALGFVHSFFRTMHREWHGIDGLRLDKFYALIRKFVHQSLLLLANHEWDTELVQRFVSVISGEVMSRLPNGLRLHVTDLYVEEMRKAVGETVDGDAFLLLLEPFFTLLSSEYDKTVFKRVRELVFGPLLSTYVFGKAPEKTKKKKRTKKKQADAGETDEEEREEEEEEEEEEKRFPLVELARVQHRIFAIASADDTAERNRSALYELYGQFFKLTKVDSLKAAATLAESVKKVSSKRKQREEEEAVAEKEKETKKAEGGAGEGEKKKRKRRKKNKKDEEQEGGEDATMEDSPPAAEEVPVEKEQRKTKEEAEEPKTPATTPVKTETPTKKTKKKEGEEKKKEEDVVMAEDKKTKKKKVKQEEEEEKEEPVATKETNKKTKATKAEPVTEKKEKKIKAEPVAEVKEPALKKEKKTKVKAEPVEEPTPVSTKKEKKVKTEKKTEDADVVVRSGMKLRRCAGCGGIGKGLVPVGKQTCRHCERTGAFKKKEMKEAKKAKRKADEMASSSAMEADEASSKKVTFGKNRALAHELSVKRLKASAKEPATKELTETHKGVLRVKSSPTATSSKAKKSKSRMKAADFF